MLNTVHITTDLVAEIIAKLADNSKIQGIKALRLAPHSPDGRHLSLRIAKFAIDNFRPYLPNNLTVESALKLDLEFLTDRLADLVNKEAEDERIKYYKEAASLGLHGAAGVAETLVTNLTRCPYAVTTRPQISNDEPF